jgi:hypothetical protein
VLEGNSAQPRVPSPLSRDNHVKYYELLLGHAFEYIDAQRKAGRREPTALDRINQ